MNRLGVVFLMMLAVATLRGVASGHDIGAMSVRIDATGGKECVVEVLVDMEHRSPGVSLSTPEEVAIVLQTSSSSSNGESCPLVGLSSVGEAAGASGARLPGFGCGTCRASGPIVQVAWRNGLPTGQYLLRVRMGPSEESSNQWLEGGIKSRIFEGQASEAEERTGAVVLTYLELGFTQYCAQGLDHILFVVGLFLLSARVRPLLKQATVFTVSAFHHAGVVHLWACPGAGVDYRAGDCVVDCVCGDRKPVRAAVYILADRSCVRLWPASWNGLCGSVAGTGFAQQSVCSYAGVV